MDPPREHAARRQLEEISINAYRLRGNSRQGVVASLTLGNDDMAQSVVSHVTPLQHLQDLRLALLDVTDPEGRGVANLVQYVKNNRNLTSLSLENTHLRDDNHNESLEGRERVVDAFLEAAIENPSIRRVSLDCCRYWVDRLAQLLRKSELTGLRLSNCRSLDNLRTQSHARILLEAFKMNQNLEEVWIRGGFEPVEYAILTQIANHKKLSHVAVSVSDVPTALSFQGLIESSRKEMVFGLVGSHLKFQIMDPILQALARRQLAFHVELHGCRWDNDAYSEATIGQLLRLHGLKSLTIDKNCGPLDHQRIRRLQDIVPVEYRLAVLVQDEQRPVGWLRPPHPVVAIFIERQDPTAAPAVSPYGVRSMNLSDLFQLSLRI